MTEEQILDKLLKKFPHLPVRDYNYWSIGEIEASYWKYDREAEWSSVTVKIKLSEL